MMENIISDRINKNDFVNKTISKINYDAVNEVKFYFTDGTCSILEVSSEIPVLGFYGITQQFNLKNGNF